MFSVAELRAVDLDLVNHGVWIVRSCLGQQLLRQLDEVFPATLSNVRNALSMPTIRELSRSSIVRSLVIPTLGSNCFSVRAILFNKTASSNWKVSWHQDVVIAVKEYADLAGYGPWSNKSGVPHVRPPAAILENMLAVRLHLDDCGEENGPLRVLPGSHTHGILSDAEIVAMNGAPIRLLRQTRRRHTDAPARATCVFPSAQFDCTASDPSRIRFYRT